MIRSLCSKLEDVKKIRSLIDSGGSLNNYDEFCKWWFSSYMTANNRCNVLKLLGVLNIADKYKSSENMSMLHLPNEPVSFDECFSKSKPCMKQMKAVYNNILDLKEYRDVDVAFSSIISFRLFKYMARLGFKQPEELVTLYKVGALGDDLRVDAEKALSNEIVDTVLPKDMEIRFAEDINNLLNVIPSSKYQYVRIARVVKVPNHISQALGRIVTSEYDVNKKELLDKLFKRNRYTVAEKLFLSMYIVDSEKAIEVSTLSPNVMNELIGDMGMMM